MAGKVTLCVSGLLVAASAWAGGAFHGGIELLDASNADRPVGASPALAIPQGHTLRLVVQDARFGAQPAAGAALMVHVRSGGQAVASAAGTLDEAGVGEVMIPIGAEWLGQHHVDATVREAGVPEPREGGFQGEFRVVEAEPAPEIPFAMPAVLLVLAAVTLVIWWNRRAPQTA